MGCAWLLASPVTKSLTVNDVPPDDWFVARRPGIGADVAALDGADVARHAVIERAKWMGGPKAHSAIGAHWSRQLQTSNLV